MTFFQGVHNMAPSLVQYLDFPSYGVHWRNGPLEIPPFRSADQFSAQYFCRDFFF